MLPSAADRSEHPSLPQAPGWDILGHAWAVQLLQEHVTWGTLRHAYLLTGPRGVGRRTLALRLAQALNCSQPVSAGEPCRKCRNCTQIERMQHPDLSVVQSDQAGSALKVDQIRALQHSLALAPYSARYRVALLLNFEEATISAANALLKTLEEPPPQVILILTAESAENMLPTIVSRCEVLRLRPLHLGTLEQELQTRWGLALEQARLLAHLSGGRPGYALRLHLEPDQLNERQTWLEEHKHLLTASRLERFAFADALSKDKAAMLGALEVYVSFWRDVLLRSAGSSEPIANQDRTAEIEALAGQFDLNTVFGFLKALERTVDLLDHNTNAKLALEVLWLDLPTLAHL